MGRKPRVDFPGAIHHVTSRGNNRQAIFRNDSDYRCFLDVLAAEKARSLFELFAYCLLPNHLHLLIRVATRPLSLIMRRILGRYARLHNRSANRTGHVFEKRYWDTLCTDDNHVKAALQYVHLNSLRAGLCQRPEDWRWSSYGHYLGLEEQPIVDSDFPLALFSPEPAVARRLFADHVMSGIADPLPLIRPSDPPPAPRPDRKKTRSMGLDDLADRIQRRTGIDKEALRGPCRKGEVSAARKDFVLEAYDCGFGPGEIARFIDRSCSAVCKILKHS